jgi:hypothetical protein
LSALKRLVFVLCFVVVVAALAMHRWPRPARIDLAEVQQRVEALRQEVEQARAAPDPAEATAPKALGSRLTMPGQIEAQGGEVGKISSYSESSSASL